MLGMPMSSRMRSGRGSVSERKSRSAFQAVARRQSRVPLVRSNIAQRFSGVLVIVHDENDAAAWGGQRRITPGSRGGLGSIRCAPRPSPRTHASTSYSFSFQSFPILVAGRPRLSIHR